MLIIILISNIFRILWYKILYGNRYMSFWIERINPSVIIRLYGSKSKIKIGRNVEISKDAELLCFEDGMIIIGDGCFFNNRLMISCHCGVSIGKGCLFGPDVKLFDNNHKYDADNGVYTDLNSASIQIGNHCWFASNVIVLKGTIIGDNCVIGAGCVVSGKIPSGSIVRQIKDNFIVEPICTTK